MSRREDLDNAIWTDPDFEALSPAATLLYLWSFTNLRCGMAGIYKVSERQMTESKVTVAELPAVLQELADTRFAFYEDSVLWVRSRVKHLRARSPQMAKAIASDVQKLPERHPLRVRFLAEYGDHPWLRDTLSVLSGEGTGTVSEKPVSKGNSDTVTGRSLDRPGQGQVVGVKGLGGSGGEGGNGKVELPADFPDELRPHLTAAFKVLRSLAERHQAKAVSPLALAQTVMARPYKPIVKGAHDCAAYWDSRSQRVKDVVAAYRNWLDRTDDLATFEVLGRTQATNGAETSAAYLARKGLAG